MTDASLAARPSAQLSAIVELRRRLFVNALRTTRGKLELLSQIMIGIGFAGGGLGGALGLGFAADMMFSAGRPDLLALLFWFIFLFWQVFPIMATQFASNPDATDLLRFPLSYRSYVLVRLAYGAIDPATAMGSLWLCGIVAGVGYAKPGLVPWALLVIVAFAAFNLLFTQMVFAWVERWLAQRRTRELLGVLFVLLMLSFQLIGPAIRHFEKSSSRTNFQRYVGILAPVQRILPPGLAGDAIAQAAYPHVMQSFSSFALLCASALLIAYTLHVRLLAQYRGENLSEVAAASSGPKDASLHEAWKLPGLSAPVAAVFEKEIRYLMRSGPTLLTLIMPVFVLLIIRFGGNAQSSGLAFTHAHDLAFPAAAAYALLILTNLICNSFGGDAGGIQFFYASPVSFREIVLAKNLVHAGILAIEAFVAWIAAGLLYGSPPLDVTIATLVGLLFAAPLNFATGNLLSIYSPKKVDYSSFRRQRPSQMSVLISLAVQFFIIGVGALAFWIARYYRNYWIATAILLVLAGISLIAYRMILNCMDALALERRETMVAELCRA